MACVCSIWFPGSAWEPASWRLCLPALHRSHARKPGHGKQSFQVCGPRQSLGPRKWPDRVSAPLGTSGVCSTWFPGSAWEPASWRLCLPALHQSHEDAGHGKQSFQVCDPRQSLGPRKSTSPHRETPSTSQNKICIAWADCANCQSFTLGFIPCRSMNAAKSSGPWVASFRPFATLTKYSTRTTYQRLADSLTPCFISAFSYFDQNRDTLSDDAACTGVADGLTLPRVLDDRNLDMRNEP